MTSSSNRSGGCKTQVGASESSYLKAGVVVTFGAMEVVDMLALTLLEMLLGAGVGVMIGSLIFVGPVLGIDGGSDGPIGGVVMLAGGLTSREGGIGVGDVGGMLSRVVSGRGSRMSLALAELEMLAEGPAWRL